MKDKVQPSHSDKENNPVCLQFTSPVISSAPGILKKSGMQHQNLKHVGGKSSVKEAPFVNKFLNVGMANDSLTSDGSSSPGSPLTDSAQKKLRDLPHTTTLQGCVAYVDVWSSDATDNRSSVFRNFLTRMGAKVAKKFTKDQPITHVVFKDGHKSVLQKAQKRNIKIVTCLWVDRCRVLQKWVSEEDFIFNPTNYKPPKKFVEMQPLEPEEQILRSAENLKRRKARFAKKNARIMFQSPLVTNSHSAAGTPTEGNTPSNQAVLKKYGIYAADTPFNPTSICRYFSPSVVCETPLTDSMQRMMQRLKEGKRVFSPPTSDDGSDAENDERKSPSRPEIVVDGPIHNSPNNRPNFSPVADTQCVMKRSWRHSGISPPKFNVSCDEIPETQQVVAPDTPKHLTDGTAKVPELIEGIKEIPETQHLNVSLSSDDATQLPLPPLYTSTAKDCCEGLPCFDSELKQLDSKERFQSYNFQDDSTPDIHLQISANSSHMDDNSSLKNNSTQQEHLLEKQADELTPSDQKLQQRPFVESRRKKRKLLEDHECMEPLSVLVSPQMAGKDTSDRRKGRKSSVLLPELGFSAYKSLTQSGKYFAKLPCYAPSECSSTSQQSSPSRSSCGTQSTEFDSQSQTKKLSLKSPLCLYDRIKMRSKRNSTISREITSATANSSTLKKRRRDSNDPSTKEGESSKQPKTKIARTQITVLKESPLFYSQAARSIMESMKKRRSTMDFISPTVRSLTTRSRKSKRQDKCAIVLTNFHSDERFDVHQAVRHLSKFRISSSVRDQTTHVVCGAARRTMNVLRAIARGLWLLSKNWVTDSISAGFWLEEESYEIPGIFPAAEKNRRCRSRNPMWKNELFSKFEGHIYISDETKPSQDEIKELVTLCGASTVGSPRRAVLCVGKPGRVIPDIPVVSETWVLDSITEDSLKPLGPYLVPAD